MWQAREIKGQGASQCKRMSAIGAQVVEYFYKFSIFKIIVGNIYMEGNDQPLRQSKNFLCMPGREGINKVD